MSAQRSDEDGHRLADAAVVTMVAREIGMAAVELAVDPLDEDAEAVLRNALDQAKPARAAQRRLGTGHLRLVSSPDPGAGSDHGQASPAVDPHRETGAGQ